MPAIFTRNGGRTHIFDRRKRLLRKRIPFSADKKAREEDSTLVLYEAKTNASMVTKNHALKAVKLVLGKPKRESLWTLLGPDPTSGPLRRAIASNREVQIEK